MTVAVGSPDKATTGLRSLGITRGVVCIELRSIELSSLRVSELIPRKLRVYNTFSATYWRDHSGRAPISMLLPQLAARSLFSVSDAEYEAYVEMLEY